MRSLYFYAPICKFDDDAFAGDFPEKLISDARMFPMFEVNIFANGVATICNRAGEAMYTAVYMGFSLIGYHLLIEEDTGIKLKITTLCPPYMGDHTISSEDRTALLEVEHRTAIRDVLKKLDGPKDVFGIDGKNVEGYRTKYMDIVPEDEGYHLYYGGSYPCTEVADANLERIGEALYDIIVKGKLR